MKKFIFGGVVALFSLALTGCEIGTDVVEYNDTLVNLQNGCYDVENEMMNAWNEENYGIVKTLYPTTLETCTTAQSTIAAMDAYKGDSSLRDAFDAELQLEVAYLHKIGEILTYWEYDELTDEQQAAESALWDELSIIEEQLNTANEASITTQETFATQYGYALEKDEGEN